MTKMITKLTGIVLLITLFCTGSVFASEQTSIIKNDLKIISKNELPSNVIPMKFNSDEEALAYLNKTFSNIDTQLNPIVCGSGGTKGNATVATKRISTNKIYLKLRYSTSGNANTGRITSLDPYTQFTGFTLGFDWHQNSIGADIDSNGKDVYVYTEGSLEYYILVNSLLKFYSRPISLSGDVAVIR
jgi:hypothetical protein